MKKPKLLSIINALIVACIAIAMPAFAQGLDKANESVDTVIAILNGVSIGVATIAFMWIGFRYLFSTIDKTEIGRIVIGALIIGGAAQLAAFFIG